MELSHKICIYISTLDIIKEIENLVTKNLSTNFIKMNEH